VTTLHDFGSVLGWYLNTSVGLGHGSWLVCEVALRQVPLCQSKISSYNSIDEYLECKGGLLYLCIDSYIQWNEILSLIPIE
jgi:hypothetical protein